MPHFVFTFEPAAAGCVERVCLFTPWTQPARGPDGGIMQPWQQAYGFLMQYAQQRDPQNNPLLVFTPGVQFKCTCITPGGAGNTPNIYCIQKADPYIDRQQVNAPFNMPVASGRNFTPPPLPSKERVVPQGMYEDMHDCALAATSDSILGEMDGAAGTFTDIDSQGNEVVRGVTAPFPRKVTG